MPVPRYECLEGEKIEYLTIADHQCKASQFERLSVPMEPILQVGRVGASNWFIARRTESIADLAQQLWVFLNDKHSRGDSWMRGSGYRWSARWHFIQHGHTPWLALGSIVTTTELIGRDDDDASCVPMERWRDGRVVVESDTRNIFQFENWAARLIGLGAP